MVSTKEKARSISVVRQLGSCNDSNSNSNSNNNNSERGPGSTFSYEVFTQLVDITGPIGGMHTFPFLLIHPKRGF